MTAAFDYDYGGVLDLATPNVSLANVSQSTVVRQRQSAAGKISGIGSEVEDTLDGVVSLDQRRSADSGRYVQCVGGAH